MPKVVIHKLGPVEYCALEINDFTVFTGPQASGKSAVAKSIFFFKNIKNIIFEQFKKKCLLNNLMTEESINLSFKKRIEREIRSNFLQIFGTTWHMDTAMSLEYCYSATIYVQVSLKTGFESPNYIWLEFSQNLKAFIRKLEMMTQSEEAVHDDQFLLLVKERINQFFDDEAEIVFVPAGRSMITLLSTQLNYLYSSMDDTQKKNLDYCTQSYLERILRLKPEFSLSADQMIQNTIHLTDRRINKTLLFSAAELMRKILKGEYRFVDGEERLQLSSDQYIKINFSSSGQQEVVWILNVIFYYLLNNRKTYFIIEEPESHLFPNAQKLIAEFISLAQNGGKNQIFITTHSPYILGAINNLLYADRISGLAGSSELAQIVSSDKWMRFSALSAYFIDRGRVVPCTDDEFGSIENEVIDGASVDINSDYEKMVLLKEKYLSGGGI